MVRRVGFKVFGGLRGADELLVPHESSDAKCSLDRSDATTRFAYHASDVHAGCAWRSLVSTLTQDSVTGPGLLGKHKLSEMQMKVVVVGASSGMGVGTVKRLVAQGKQVVGLDLESAAWPEGLELAARFPIDVSQESSVDVAIESAAGVLDGIDAVVNCAGILGPVKPLVETASPEFSQLLNVNLIGAFHVTRAALRVMQPKGYGRIVHIASIAGKEGNPGMAGYSASKAGVIGMVKAVAKEVADSGITINAIAPASIETPLIMGMTPERREAQKSLIPVGRFGTVEEIAALVEFIISRDASFTTGFTFDMSGGRAVY